MSKGVYALEDFIRLIGQVNNEYQKLSATALKLIFFPHYVTIYFLSNFLFLYLKHRAFLCPTINIDATQYMKGLLLWLKYRRNFYKFGLGEREIKLGNITGKDNTN